MPSFQLKKHQKLLIVWLMLHPEKNSSMVIISGFILQLSKNIPASTSAVTNWSYDELWSAFYNVECFKSCDANQKKSSTWACRNFLSSEHLLSHILIANGNMW